MINLFLFNILITLKAIHLFSIFSYKWKTWPETICEHNTPMEEINEQKWNLIKSSKKNKLGDLDWTHLKILAWAQSRSTKDKQGFELSCMKSFFE